MYKQTNSIICFSLKVGPIYNFFRMDFHWNLLLEIRQPNIRPHLSRDVILYLSGLLDEFFARLSDFV